MPVTRLNHAVLYVRNVERSAVFYRNALQFKVVMSMPGAVFLQAPASNNDHDLGLFEIGNDAGTSMAGRSTVGLYHLAWEVDTLNELKKIGMRLHELKALTGATDHGTTKALYGKDPDGIEFEVSWLVPASLITDEMQMSKTQLRALNLDIEIANFGGDTKGGIGISNNTDQ